MLLIQWQKTRFLTAWMDYGRGAGTPIVAKIKRKLKRAVLGRLFYCLLYNLQAFQISAGCECGGGTVGGSCCYLAYGFLTAVACDEHAACGCFAVLVGIEVSAVVELCKLRENLVFGKKSDCHEKSVKVKQALAVLGLYHYRRKLGVAQELLYGCTRYDFYVFKLGYFILEFYFSCENVEVLDDVNLF